MDVMETEERGGLRLVIFIDPEPGSPRDWDNLGTMVCEHRRYLLGDKGASREAFEALEASGEAIWLPLYLYDHSGLAMSTGPFSCPWDSGQVGVIYVSKEKVREEYGCKRISAAVKALALEVLKAEVAEYDQYLRGDVYGFMLKDAEGETLDSCWGFFGMEHCREEARRALGYLLTKGEGVAA